LTAATPDDDLRPRYETKRRPGVTPPNTTSKSPIDVDKASVHQQNLDHSNKRTKRDHNTGMGKSLKHSSTLASELRATILSSWINLLLVYLPIGIALYSAHVNPVAVFFANFIAPISLAATLSYTTEEATRRTGQIVGSLLNTTLRSVLLYPDAHDLSS
jgi:Ca2+:H+ antiporter